MLTKEEKLNKINRLISHAQTLADRETDGSSRQSQLEGRIVMLKKWKRSIQDSLNSYIVTSRSNYGVITVIIQAKSRETVKEIADNNNHCWPGYSITKLEENQGGVVYDSAETDYA